MSEQALFTANAPISTTAKCCRHELGLSCRVEEPVEHVVSRGYHQNLAD
jgi:hypothetical protein